MPAIITTSSALCAAGRGTEQLWASVRAGISRISGSGVVDSAFEIIQMGLVPEDALAPELLPEMDAAPLPARARRMLRLGAPALKAIVGQAGAPPLRLYLGLPELPIAEAPWLRAFALQLAKLAGTSIDAPNSRVVPRGRAAALIALELALEALERDPSHSIVVGAVDSYLDLRLLASLDAVGRILGRRVMDGFIPGEGAAFLVLSHSSAAGNPGTRVTVEAAASVADPGHRTGSEPARGEGLAQALDLLRTRAGGGTPVATAFAGFNGEHFDAKLWGVARLRHAGFLSPTIQVEHPADCYGDAGAATGALLLALGATALGAGQRPAPALVWAASDGESRACALLSVAPGLSAAAE